MNKKILLWTFVFVLLAFSVSAENFTVQDSFNRADATLDGQTATNGNNWGVSGNTVTTYNNEFRSVADDTTQTAYFNLDKQINSSNGWRSAIEVQMRTSSTSCKGTIRFRTTGNDEVIYAGMQDYLCDNDNCYIAGDGDTFETLIDPFTLGVNYSFRIGEFNYSALKARAWLNGVDKGLITMKNYSIERFTFLGGNGCTYYADNITIVNLDGVAQGGGAPPVNNAPVVTKTEINTTTNLYYDNEDFTPHCTITDADNATIDYKMELFINGVAEVLYSANHVTQGTRQAMNTYLDSIYDFDIDDEIMASCYGDDGANVSERLNHTVIVTARPPTFTQNLQNKNIANTIESLYYEVNCTDPYGSTMVYTDNTTLFNINSSTGLIQHSPTIGETGAYNIEIMCEGDYSNTTQTFIYNITNTGANVTNVRAVSPSFSIYDNINLYCTADDTENTIKYFWGLYLDGTLNKSGETGYITGGTEQQLTNITTDEIADNFNYTFQCTAFDGYENATWRNVSFRIFDFFMDNCSVYGTTSGIFNIFYEDFPTIPLYVDNEIYLTYWFSNASKIKNFTAIVNNESNFSICIYPLDKQIRANAYIKYTHDTGFTHRYILVNESFNNITRYFDMFNYNYTTGVSDLKITVRYRDTYQYYENVVVKLQRFYVGEGVWRTVQMDESDDFGLVFFNVVEQSNDYRLVFSDRSNNILKITSRMKFSCTDGVCSLDYLLDPYAATAAPTTIVLNWEYSNETTNLTATWTDEIGLTNTVYVLVTKQTITGEATLCEKTQTASTGSIVCDLNGYTGEVFVFIEGNDIVLVSEWLKLSSGFLSSNIDLEESVFWTFAIMLVVISFGLFSPVGAIIASIIGLILIYFLGIFNAISLMFIIIASAMGIALGLKIKK